jgi:hypothetical protein
VLGGGKEYATVEAMRPHCSRQSRHSHCSCRRGGSTAPTARRSRLSHCSTEVRGDPATASTSTGIGEQGPIWGQCAQIWALIFKNRFWVRKIIYFLYPKYSIEPIRKITLQPILQSVFVVVKTLPAAAGLMEGEKGLDAAERSRDAVGSVKYE